MPAELDNHVEREPRQNPVVGIVMGSESDLGVTKGQLKFWKN